MIRFFERALNLRPGDLGRGSLLFLYLLLIISSYTGGKIARDALFLDRFEAVKLPYADIASAVLVGVIVAGYLSIARRVSLRDLLVGSLLLFSSNCALFWYLAHYHSLPWLFPVLYVWVGVFGVLAPMQVWTLANYLLTTREAKRIFGVVGAGAISGWIFGGLASRLAVKRFGTESIILGMAVCLAASAAVVVLIWRQRQQDVLEAGEAASVSADQQPTVVDSLRQIASSPYLLAISALICVSSFVTTFAGWQFKAIAKEFIPEKNTLALFFSDFQFVAALICLATQMLLTSRALRRFGLGFTLFVVPLALLGGTIAVLVWGTLLSVIVLKGSDNVLRYSLDKSSVELLYLPLASDLKLRVKSFIDTFIWRLGDGLAGLALALFADHLRFTARQVGWVNLVLIGGWLGAAAIARRQYVATLKDTIQQHRLDTERQSVPVLDRSTSEILASNLTAADPKEVLYALGLFDVDRGHRVHPAMRGLLEHPAPEVRQKVVTMLSEAGDRSVQKKMEDLLHDPSLEVRTEALLYLTHHGHIDPLVRLQELGDFADFSVRSAMVAFLAKPGETQNLVAAHRILEPMVAEPGPGGARTRLEAARLIASLPDAFEKELEVLLRDPEPEVARHAIRAVGRLRKRRLLPALLDRIADPELNEEVVDAIVNLGDSVVGTLHDHLADQALPAETRVEIARILGLIGTLAAGRVLMENLLQSDTALRFRVISALNKLRQARPELELDTLMVETVLAAEIIGHYRSYQILGTLGGSLEGDDTVLRTLRETMDLEVERIFRLLSLLHPQYDLHSAYVGLQSKNAVVHDNALEFLDNVLKPQLRSALVPLLDSEVGLAERARLAAKLVHTSVETREEAVAALVASEDPWLKSCGAYAIGTLRLFSLAEKLEACLTHDDPLLRETARQAKVRLATLG
jgi:AAA family ATP:ADP antiporter